MGCSPSTIGNKDQGAKISQTPSHPVSLNSIGHKMLQQPERKLSDGNLIKFGPMSIYRSRQLQLLVAFPRDDSLYGGIQSAAERLKWQLTWVKSEPSAWSSLSEHPHSIDLLLLDYRQPKLLPPDTLSILKSLKEENSVLVAVAIVKKNFYEKIEPIALNALLDSGIDKVEVDYGLTSTNFWLNELVQMERSLVSSAYKLSAAKALVAALDHCRDMVQITDSSHRIQFVNRAYEKVIGYSCSEVSGSDFLELQSCKGFPQSGPGDQQQVSQLNCQYLPASSIYHSSSSSPSRPDTASPTNPNPNPSPVTQQQLNAPSQPFHDHLFEELSQGKEWEGNYMYNRKTGDPIFLNSRVLPFSSKASVNSSTSSPDPAQLSKPKSPTHFIYMSDTPSSYVEKSFSSDVTSNQESGYPMPRGSLKSLRKASYDIKSISNDSSILRRQSLAKLHSLTIEAPITKVINIIAAAQQNCPLYIAQALEKVLEILRTTELYSPQFFEGNRVRSDDPLTTDLLGALLSQGPRPNSVTGRRSSNEITVSRLAPRPSLPDIAEAPTSLQKLLESESRWDFDVVLLEEITEKRPLVWLGMTTFARFGVAQTLNTDETTLRNWLTLIEANYHSTNAYHNSTHAADVMQATAYFLSTDRLKTFLEPLDEAISLIAAVVHDVDHPGKNSAFMTNSGNELALLYNDLCVLESHHAALTFKLTLSDPRVNIFKNLDSETYKVVRRSIIDMVLATEMTKHFEHLSKFLNVFTKPLVKEDNRDQDPSPLTPTEPDISTLVTSDNIVLIKRMLIKCADVGNPTRPLKLCVEWAKRIAEEYFRQTEEEISRSLPPVMPMFDRATCSIPKSQTGFIDYFVADMYEAWDAFLDVPEVIDHMKLNYDYWKELDNQGARAAIYLDNYIAPRMGTSRSSDSQVSQL